MEEPSFSGLLVVVAVAFAAPFLLGLVPRLRLPSVVFEIVAGIVIGPSVLGWVELDQTIEVALPARTRLPALPRGARDRFRPPPRAAAESWRRSGGRSRSRSRSWPLRAQGRRPGRDAAARGDHPLRHLARRDHPGAQGRRRAHQPFGQLVLAAASIADFGAVILLSLFFSGESGPGPPRSCSALFSPCLAVYLVVTAAPSARGGSSDDLLRLQDTTAQIRVRAAMVLMVAFVAAGRGSRPRADPGLVRRRRAAGAARPRPADDPSPVQRASSRRWASGSSSPCSSSPPASASTSTRCSTIPPTWRWCRSSSRRCSRCAGCPRSPTATSSAPREARIAGILQATSLPFIVAATTIGQELGLIDARRVLGADRRRPALGADLPDRRADPAATCRARQRASRPSPCPRRV